MSPQPHVQKAYKWFVREHESFFIYHQYISTLYITAHQSPHTAHPHPGVVRTSLALHGPLLLWLCLIAGETLDKNKS